MFTSNNKLNLKQWSQCDLYTQHLHAEKNGNISVEKGSAYKAYGWEYNSLIKNPSVVILYRIMMHLNNVKKK